MKFVNKHLGLTLIILSLIITIESIIIVFLLYSSNIKNTNISSDSIRPTLNPTETIAITSPTTIPTVEIVISSPTPFPTKVVSVKPVVEKIKKSIVSNLAYGEYCKDLEIQAEIPLDTTFKSGEHSADQCLAVTLSNSDFQLTYYVYGGGDGCLDTTNAIKIGELKSNGLPIYRMNRPNPSGSGYFTTYHTKYKPTEKECIGVTNFAELKGYGSISIRCDKNVNICDEIVRSISANTEFTNGAS